MTGTVIPFRMNLGPMTEGETLAAKVRRSFAKQVQRQAPHDLVDLLASAVTAAKHGRSVVVPGPRRPSQEWDVLVAAIAERVKAEQ